MPGQIRIEELPNGRYGLRTCHGWFAYHIANIDIAGVVRGRLMQDWDALSEDVNFSYPEAFIASDYDGVSR